MLLDNLYGIRTQASIARESGYSPQRIGQLVEHLRRGQQNPQIVSARCFRQDLRNKVWENSPEAMYMYERGLTQWETDEICPADYHVILNPTINGYIDKGSNPDGTTYVKIRSKDVEESQERSTSVSGRR